MHDEGLNRLLGKAARFCTLRERSPKEVEKKLLKWETDERQIAAVISRLKKEGFLDEERFARAYCHDKFEFNKWGKVKIRFEIKRHLNDEDFIQIGLNHIDSHRYEDTLLELARKKWESIVSNDEFEKKQKVAAYLIRKGFESHLVFEQLDKMSNS